MNHLKNFKMFESSENEKITLDNIQKNLDIYKKVSKVYPIISDMSNKIIRDAGLNIVAYKLGSLKYVDIDKIKNTKIDKEGFINLIKSEYQYDWSKRLNPDMSYKELFSIMNNIYITKGMNELISLYLNNPNDYTRIPDKLTEVDMSADEIIEKIENAYSKISNLDNVKNDIKAILTKYDLKTDDLSKVLFDILREEDSKEEEEE